MLKSPEQVLKHRIESSTVTAQLLGFRVYPIVAPVSAALPFAVYQRSVIERNQTLSVPVGVPRVSVQIDTYAATYEEARQIADALRANLDGWSGSAYGVDVKHVALESERDGFVQLDGSELPPVYQVTQTFDVAWQET
jgi:hypothetical protein